MRDRRDMVCVQGGGGWGVEGLVRGASPDYNLTFPTAWNDRKYNRPLCSLHILQPTVKCKLAFSKSEYQLQTHRMSDKYQSTAAKKLLLGHKLQNEHICARIESSPGIGRRLVQFIAMHSHLVRIRKTRTKIQQSLCERFKLGQIYSSAKSNSIQV